MPATSSATSRYLMVLGLYSLGLTLLGSYLTDAYSGDIVLAVFYVMIRGFSKRRNSTPANVA